MEKEIASRIHSSEMHSPKRSLILLVGFLDIFGVGLVMPLVTPLIKDLGASPWQVGLLSSIYGAVQLITGPFMGLLSDQCGRKVIIIVSFVGTAVGYVLLAYSSTIWLVVISRITTGGLKHSQNALKAYLADHSTKEARAVELGRMATASGLGIMVGPAIGGYLHKFGGYQLPIFLSSTLFLIASFLVNNFLKKPQTFQGHKKGPKEYQLIPKISMLLRPPIFSLFIVRLMIGLSLQLYRQGLSLLVLYGFKATVGENGALISYQGFLSAMVQGFALKPLTRNFQEASLMFFGILALGISFLGSSFSPNLPILALLLTPVALSSGILRTTFAAILTNSVAQDEVGQILGLSDAAMSFCRVLGPAFGGALASWQGSRSPCLLGGILMFVAAGIYKATENLRRISPNHHLVKFSSEGELVASSETEEMEALIVKGGKFGTSKVD